MAPEENFGQTQSTATEQKDGLFGCLFQIPFPLFDLFESCWFLVKRAPALFPLCLGTSIYNPVYAPLFLSVRRNLLFIFIILCYKFVDFSFA
ncbi:hypothetical protein NMG60_11032125 [Bertholletia excelsa]